MLGKRELKGAGLFYEPLSNILNNKNPLYKLANEIDWQFIEDNLSKFYSKRGRPSHPIRLMSGLLILKSLRNLSDEKLADELWEENFYYQYFCGEEYARFSKPCASSDLVHFRKRIGKEGVLIIMQASIKLHDKKNNSKKSNNKEEIAYADTTVQEKNITFPTDSKLAKKIVDKCNQIAKKERLKLKNNFKKKSQKLLQAQHNRSHPKRREKALISSKELKRIAGVISRDLERQLITSNNIEKYKNLFELFYQKLSEDKNSKDKIYSFHEPETHCISKGKAHKRYEFGSKFGVLWSKDRGIILSGFDSRNGYDGHTINGLIDNYKKVNDSHLTDIYCDRGYKGSKVEGINIHIPKPPKKRTAVMNVERNRSTLETEQVLSLLSVI